MPESHFLSFPCKRGDAVDLSPLRTYISSVYGSEKLGDVLPDIEEINRRRNEAVAASGAGCSEGAKDIFASYYRALCAVETRFPITRDPQHAQVLFCWSNALSPKKKTKQTNIHFEKSAILFNMAAHLSQQAASQNRESREGYKAAISCFKESAGLFALTKETALKVDNPKPSDLAADFLTMAEKLVLAQGQEAVFWKAKSDNTSPSVLSRVAKQASVLYSEALEFFAAHSAREAVDKSWKGLINSKSLLFEALCQSNAAQASRDNADVSAEISRLRQAAALLEKLDKGGKAVSKALGSVVQDVLSATNQRLRAAERDNSVVYLQRIPSFNELPAIVGAELVKPVECSVLDASGEHIFGSLVPDHIVRAHSRYSESVDKKLKAQFEKLEGAAGDYRGLLKQHELPDVVDSVDRIGPHLLRETIQRDLEAVAQFGGIERVERIKTDLRRINSAIEADLQGLKRDLDDESILDQRLRELHGVKWTPATSVSRTAGLRRNIQEYKEQLSGAAAICSSIEASLKTHREKLRMLSIEIIAQKIPKLKTNTENLIGLEPQSIVTKLRNSLDKLAALELDRAKLEKSLEAMQNSENMLPKLLITGTSSHEELFNAELQKYNQLVADVDKNVRENKELLSYIKTVFEDFKQIFDITGWKEQSEIFIREIKTDICRFEEIQLQAVNGTSSYDELKKAVDDLKRNVADYLMNRTTEREDLLQEIKANRGFCIVN